MNDYEVDDIAFLTGDSRQGIDKRELYEPSGMVERVRRVVLSPRRACLVAIACFLAIVSVALIAAFARPYVFCPCGPLTAVPSSSPSDHADTTQPPTPPTATNGQSFPWQEIRLPADVHPSRYSLLVRPNLTSLLHDGTVNVTFRLMRPMSFVVLHVKRLNLSDVRLLSDHDEPASASTVAPSWLGTGTNAGPVQSQTVAPPAVVRRTLEYERHEQLYVEFSRKLAADVDHVLSLSWRGELTDKLEGFYYSTYQTSKGEKRLIATTHFEPTYARMAFPCFDEPALKATFRLSIVRDARHMALFNSPLVASERLNDGGDLYVDHFEETVRMSTYLVAFIVSDYANVTATTSSNVKVSVYAPPDQIDQAGFALEVATKVMEFYNTFFGIPYPLPKQDLVAIPDFGPGAMENWGLTTYRETAILADQQETSLGKQQLVAATITHELAHQWFGNLVTMRWWNDLWLNEGFASFVENVGADHIRPDWKMMDQFVLEKTHPALQLDALLSSHPITVEVRDPAEIESIFDTISYSKGAAIVYMLEAFLGQDTLRRGLRTYLDTFKYSNARTEDLWQVLSEESRRMNATVDVKEVMDTWTQQMGFPLINVTRRGNTVSATQQRFVVGNSPELDMANSEFVSNYGYKWRVPLTCITDRQPHRSTLIWMNLDNVEFELENDVRWIKCNVNQTGFYRVTYERDIWHRLVAALQSDHLIFSAADRASLLDDAFTLSWNNLLDARIPLQITEYLHRETDYIPWMTALDNMQQMHNNLKEKPASIYLKHYMQKLLAPIVKSLGWDDTGSHLERMLRPTVLYEAAMFGSPTVIEEAIRKFKDWKINGTRIPTSLRGVVYTVGLRFGDYSDWQYCWNYYEKTQLPSEKSTVQIALGASQDPWILSQYLEYSLQKDKVRPQNTHAVLRSIANNPIGRDMAWRFVRSRWKDFGQLFGLGSFTMSNIIADVTHRFTTPFDYQEVKTFFDNRDVGSGMRAVKNSLEKINANIEWLARNEAVVEGFLSASIEYPLT